MADITLEKFTDEVRSFLDANAEPKEEREERFEWGIGEDDAPALLEEKDEETERRELAEAKKWRAARFDAGLGWITGPTDYGGRELPGSFERAYGSLEGRYEVPGGGFFGIGLGMVAPTILAHAEDDVKDAYLAKLHRADIVGCQLFSEPGAGSDLASLQSKAELDGDEWVVTGQKVWTSGAHYSDIGEIICRTDPDAPKHRGLTGFLVDMHAPGVEVRPLRQMTGGTSFNEVFFEEVRIPDSHRLGDVNAGWGVALTTLMNERAAIGTGGTGGGMGIANADVLIGMLRHFGRDGDPMARQKLAALYSDFQVAKYTNQRAMDSIKSGQAPGPELSIAKMALTRNLTNAAQFVSEVLGPRILADTGEWGTYAWSKFVLSTPGIRIAGGSDEVLRNIVGERVLGLPKDPGIDTTSPFRDLKVGTQTT